MDVQFPRNFTSGKCKVEVSNADQMCNSGRLVRVKGSMPVACGCATAFKYVSVVDQTVTTEPEAMEDEKLEEEKRCVPYFSDTLKGVQKQFENSMEQYAATWLKACTTTPNSYASYVYRAPPVPDGSVVSLHKVKGFKWQPNHGDLDEDDAGVVTPVLGKAPTGLSWDENLKSITEKHSSTCPKMAQETGLAWCSEWAAWQYDFPESVRGRHKCGCATPYSFSESAASNTPFGFCQSPEPAAVKDYVDREAQAWFKKCLEHESVPSDTNAKPDLLCDAEAQRTMEGYDMGEALHTNDYALKVSAAIRNNPAPQPPRGFAWAPLPGGTGKYWPKLKQFCEEHCSAVFWYGVTHCDRGHREDIYPPIARGIPLRFGFGCKDGQRLQVVLQGSSSSRLQCASQFVRWEREMENIVDLATSVQVPQMLKTINTAIFRSARPHIDPPAGMAILGKPVHLEVKSSTCTIDVVAIVAKCNTPLGAYVPIAMEDGGAFKNIYVGCTCESTLHIEAEAKITWMRDQTVGTQHACDGMHAGVTSEVKAALSNLQEAANYLLPEQRDKLQFMGHQQFKSPSIAASRNCGMLAAAQWESSSVLSNQKEVESKVWQDEDTKNTMLGVVYSKQEVTLWAQERTAKEQAGADEQLSKTEAWDHTKLRIYQTKQKFIRILAMEVERKTDAKKKEEYKWINRELDAKSKLKQALKGHAKEAAEKEEASAEKAKAEKTQKVEKDTKHEVEMEKLKALKEKQHKKEVTSKNKEKEAAAKRKKQIDADMEAATSKGAKEVEEKQMAANAAADAAKVAKQQQKEERVKTNEKIRIEEGKMHALEQAVTAKDAMDGASGVIASYAEKLQTIQTNIQERLGNQPAPSDIDMQVAAPSDIEVAELGASTSHQARIR